MEEEYKHIVIATPDIKQALFIVAKDAIAFNELELRYVEKYAPTIEYLLRVLRKGFGWMEVERGDKDVENTKCKFNFNGRCTEKEIRRNNCAEQHRTKCEKYEPKFKGKFNVNFVLIEKAGQIRNM